MGKKGKPDADLPRKTPDVPTRQKQAKEKNKTHECKKQKCSGDLHMAAQSNGQTQQTTRKMDHNGPKKGDGSSQKASTSKEVGRTAKSKTANTKRKYTTAEKQNKPKNFEKRPTYKNDDQLFRNLAEKQSKKRGHEN